MSILTQIPGVSILDNYADVIEGGDAYAGTTPRNGIPGVLGLHVSDGGNYESVTFTSEAAVGDTTVQADDVSDPLAAELVRADGPPWFLRCTSGTAANVGAARKITAYDSSTNRYTVDPGFPTTVAVSDTFVLMEGFKRAPDGVDLDSDAGSIGGFDRVFSLSLVPGRQLDWEGGGNKWFEGVMELRLRMLKHKRSRRIAQLVVDTVTMFRSIVSMPAHRDPDGYVQKCDIRDSAPEVEVNDDEKVVVLDLYDIIYKVESSYL